MGIIQAVYSFFGYATLMLQLHSMDSIQLLSIFIIYFICLWTELADNNETTEVVQFYSFFYFLKSFIAWSQQGIRNYFI